MKSKKTSLTLMELAIMVAVFALAAALCLRAFVWADAHSRRSQAESAAIELAQTVAEQLKNSHGDFVAAGTALGAQVIHHETYAADYDCFDLFYLPDWTLSDASAQSAHPVRYRLGASRVMTDVPGLGKAELCVWDETHDRELVRFQVAWQEEVDGNA